MTKLCEQFHRGWHPRVNTRRLRKQDPCGRANETTNPRPGTSGPATDPPVTDSTVPRSPGFDEETRTYMQERLRLLSGSVTAITGVLATLWQRGDDGPFRTLLNFVTTLPNAALFWLVVVSGAIYKMLQRRRFSQPSLALVDGFLLQMLFVPCLLLYATSHDFAFSGFAVVVPFLVLFILARAVLVPSNALHTFLLSLPAALGVLAIQLWHGASYAYPDQPYPQSHFIDTVVQNQVLLFGAIGVAAAASRVNLGLRRRSYDAGHLGQYEIKAKIGAGAMGEVYRATHSMLRRPTAVKLLRTDIAGSSSLRRFEREVQQTSRLTHPNTVSIFDYGHTAEGVFYYAMELLDGANLKEIVETTGPMPASRVIYVLSAACGALSEAHGKGMVHRDIKPANIMLCRQGGEHDVVKILDFGMVKDLGQEAPELDGVIAGTPETMAPEAVYPEMMGPRADLYSLSAVGYYLLTGTPMFSATGIREYLRLHQTKRPDPPSQRNPGVPADLEAVILRGLSKDPGRRPKNAATLRAELLACEAAGKWGTKEADAWWAGFDKPSILDETTSSTGSPSVFATALIGEATALLLDSEQLRKLDELPKP